MGLSQVAVVALWWLAGWKLGLMALVLTHGAVLWSTFNPRSQLFCPALVRLPGETERVWLTIDDGPSDDTRPILDLLDAHAAKATFFLVGERVRARPELVREIVRRGHGVGNHSDSHPQTAFWRLGPGTLEAEIAANQRTLAKVAGAAPRWFRSVVGHTNPFIGPVLARHGLTRVAWSARGFDGVSCTPDQVLARIEPDLKPGAIVLLHEGAAHGHNVEILRRVLVAVEQRGLSAQLPPQASGSA
ncbi:Peptidoglycan/xylan/chitin deacetylase, PgdA/CDA1 family [Pseudoxanthomonas sp. GM95]|nr:Peptidoglycan/xylan/chitin deacetylase, PgdA/CDA1 family [Pseudoxanthomonas sp. GM95]